MKGKDLNNVATAKSRRPNILIADDDESIRDIFKIILENAGYNVQLKSSGEDIYDDNFNPPDLFLLDRQLSGASGLDLCRYLKSQPHTKKIPVLMVSASPDIGRLAELAGADGSIEKPFEMAQLLNKVRDYIK